MTKTPRWYQQAVFYELHVKTFFDSNQDGLGDFKGLIQKLDYLQELGITAIWLLPFYPSPLKDDGYDIADYTQVHPNYGTLEDFQTFLLEAHQRNIRVITELVLNHTSDQHPWFQRARNSSAESPYRNFYIWSETGIEFPEARIIFKDFEKSNWSWDPIAQAYYWHRFFSHQPDLNYDNPLVQKAVFEWVDFWLSMGVDGLRLDAVPYLYKRANTDCENLPETHDFLKKLRTYIDTKYPDRMLLAEANQWPEDAVNYFGKGDECHMAFHFPLMPRMYMALQQGDRLSLIDILQQTPPTPETCQWAIFLRNHDELTLEMVTEDEREYMYQTYAPDVRARINLGIRRRLAPLLNNNRKKIELLNALLFSLPGTPVIYYGDEIGMGDNYFLPDRHGVRTPMQWTEEKNAGFSKGHPHSLYLPINLDSEYHYQVVNVANQVNNSESLFSWMKNIIAIRKQHPAFSLGNLHVLHPDNTHILAYVTQYQDDIILVAANLSSFTQSVELDLTPWIGYQLTEIFSATDLPEINSNLYSLTIAPHHFYWCTLKKNKVEKSTHHLPTIAIKNNWQEIVNDRNLLEEILLVYLTRQRWFNKKNQAVHKLELVDITRKDSNNLSTCILFIAATSLEGLQDIYILPITFINKQEAKSLLADHPQAFLALLPDLNGYLIDAFYNPVFILSLLQDMGIKPAKMDFNQIRVLQTEQSNTSVVLDQQYLLKCYRRCQYGLNPEIEMARFLSSKNFRNTPEFLGELTYHNNQQQLIFLGFLQQYCPNQSTGWGYALKTIQSFFKLISAEQPMPDTPPIEAQALLGLLGDHLNLLGQRTAEMHLALIDNSEPAFKPEPFSSAYQRDIYQSIRTQLTRVIHRLKAVLNSLPDKTQPICEAILIAAPKIESRIKPLIKNKIQATRHRIHGDYHLGQVLFTGQDFLIIDFEGEPERSFAARRRKRSLLYDIAGMLRSFDYVAQTALQQHPDLALWSDFWRQWSGVYFLQGYFGNLGQNNFLPSNQNELSSLLEIFLIEKALYEIQYELNNRPDWLAIPCQGLLSILES